MHLLCAPIHFLNERQKINRRSHDNGHLREPLNLRKRHRHAVQRSIDVALPQLARKLADELADGDRASEETTSNLYRNGGLAITPAHMAAHAAVGESLVGKETRLCCEM